MEMSDVRFRVLFCNCMLTFGSYYVFDMPSVVEKDLESLLDISTTDYELFYSLYGWTNCAMSLIAGWIVDRLGCVKAAFIFLGLILVGQVMFALGATLDGIGKHNQFILMVVGRTIFGSGGGSITIVQNVITSRYFKGKELAMAFGCTLTMSRLGSVINFLTTGELCASTSLTFTLWFGTGCCFVGVVAAFAFAFIDAKVTNSGGGKTGKAVNLKDVATFDSRYWLVSALICLFYICIFVFISTAPSFFRQKWDFGNHDKKGTCGTGSGQSSDIASYISSTVYFASMVLSIPVGKMVDRIGMQAFWVIAAALWVPLVFAAFTYTDIYPLVPMIMLGLSYTMMASALWPAITLIVDLRTVGTAMGLATSLQMMGVGACTLLVGKIQDAGDGGEKNYHGSNLFFGCVGAATALLGIVLFMVDKAKDGMLSASKKERSRRIVDRALMGDLMPSS